VYKVLVKVEPPKSKLVVWHALKYCPSTKNVEPAEAIHNGYAEVMVGDGATPKVTGVLQTDPSFEIDTVHPAESVVNKAVGNVGTMQYAFEDGNPLPKVDWTVKVCAGAEEVNLHLAFWPLVMYNPLIVTVTWPFWLTRAGATVLINGTLAGGAAMKKDNTELGTL
jgi:hypothetical protein